MLKRLLQLSATAIAVVALLLGGALPALAQAITYENIPDDSVIGDFVVGPGKVEVELNPGESKTVEVLLTNRIGEERIFGVEVEDFEGSQNVEQTVVLLGGERGPYSLKDYIQVPESKITLKHAERARIPVTVSIPLDAEPGGLYGSALFKVASASVENDPGNAAAGGATIVSRIGVLFFVRVSGEVAEEGTLKEFGLKGGDSVLTSTPVNFEILFENSGSVHLNPYGIISIENSLGEVIGEREVEPWFVLPNALRLREVSWDRKPLIGKYTAKAEINRGYDDVVDTAELSFWVVPLGIVIPVIVIIIVLVLLITLLKSKFEVRKKTSGSE